MAKKLTTYQKVHRAFQELGIELGQPGQEGFVVFNYEGHNFILGVWEDDSVFYFTSLVVGVNGQLPKDIFDTALEITQKHHQNIEGHWAQDHAYINSPFYTLENRRNLPKTMLKFMLSRFFEVYLFMESCILLMMEEDMDIDESKIY